MLFTWHVFTIKVAVFCTKVNKKGFWTGSDNYYSLYG